MPNRLAEETSPYLLQHAENPVDWRPWGEEAFAEARERDVPVIVSIGYAACHWCHVMERESFEDPAVAAVMNERFVCVKVDREERPDVDAIYMEAVQAMTGQGGWPLHAFLTPDGVPFHTGTYFPPQPRQGMPSWVQVLGALGDAWRDRREEVEQVTAQILPRLAGAAALQAPEGKFDPAALDGAVRALRSTYDAEHGGWGGAPKFPAASVIEFLLARAALAGLDGAAEERRMALHALRRMAAGGIYDQLGGGFARYAVDARWIVPHFEKMLYDNALLARAYLHAFQLTGEPRFHDICVETLDWALRDLVQEEGGFASSLDADSEGEEGRFYVWTRAQLEDVLGRDRAAIAATRYGVVEPGTFEGGASVLVRAAPDPPELEAIRRELLAAREQRVWPALDDKRLTSWNALMIAALADAGAVLGREDYLDAARACAEFVLTSLTDADGRLLRSYNRGIAKTPAFLEDHAFLLEALLALYEATFEPRWFTAARGLADTILARFADAERGGFFSTADDQTGLVARRKDLEDTPIPSGASSAALGLLRLSRLTGEATYEDAALGQLRLLHAVAPQHPVAFGHLLQALQFAQAPVREVALAGPSEGVRELVSVVRETLRPFTVLAGGEEDPTHPGPELLEGRSAVDGAAAAYVCERFTCRLPVTDPDALRESLQPPAPA